MSTEHLRYAIRWWTGKKMVGKACLGSYVVELSAELKRRGEAP